jgi:DNA modification methylase
VWNLLSDDGTLWLNLGDSYAGSGKGPSNSLNGEHHHLEAKHSKIVPDGLKPKDLIGVPWRVAFALQSFGWYLRQDIIWHKPNPMPESVTDRCTKSHEYIFLLTKSAKYYYDYEAIQEPAQYWGERDRTNGKYHNEGTGLNPHSGLTGKKKTNIRFGGNKYGDSDDPKHATKSGNEWEASETRTKRSVWSVTNKPFTGAHFATFPPDLIEPCVMAGSRIGDIVLDPFMGSGTTAAVADRLNRAYLGCELNSDYEKLQKERLLQRSLDLI